MTVTNPEIERLGVFLTGQRLDIEAADLGTHEEWAASARSNLSKAINGASGANTVRVSVAALTVLLSMLDPIDGGARG